MSSNNSPSPHPSAVRSPSPAFSDSSLAEQSQSISGLDEPFDPVADPSDSSPGSPSLQDERALQSDSARCLWDDCGQIFLHLPTLIDHIHNEHIGVNKSNYTCEWATCPRRGLQQASRFALISHLRAHTGEKPYTCPRPECDKSFTRSDAMAKHMRLQHNMSTPQPGRGGNRKRKREEPAEPPEAPASGPGFSSFKIDQSTHAYDVDEDFHLDENNTEFLLPPPATRTRSTSPGAVSTSSLDEHEDDLPQRLKDAMDPETGKIYGRTPDMCRYIIMKAKHRYLLQQHEQLLEELRVARFEERKARAGKERALDRVLGRTLG